MTHRFAFDVAIVGGGASGTLLAIQLLRRAPRGWRLLLVDRSGDFGRGIAYRTDDASHLLNVAASRMSALPDEAGHFAAWLGRRDASAGPDSYALRSLYGDYLSELLRDTERSAASGPVLERRVAEVQEVKAAEGGVLLRFGPGSEVLARHAVLALGNFPPPRLDTSPTAFSRVWQSPWLREVAWPPPTTSILLVGAGLTAVDWLLALSARGHQGELHVLSRHGLLPLAHQTPPAEPLTLMKLPYGRIRPLVRALREAATHTLADWRQVVDGARPLAQELWASLDAAERRRFSRHVRTYWEVHRHRLAPAAARRVEALLASGQLTVHAGRLLSVSGAASKLQVAFRPRGTTLEKLLAVDLAINCTGPAGHSVNADALVDALLQARLARPGPLGLGLSSDAEGALVDGGGNAHGTLWTLGPVRRGDHWESTAVPDIRNQAAALAKRLTQIA